VNIATDNVAGDVNSNDDTSRVTGDGFGMLAPVIGQGFFDECLHGGRAVDWFRLREACRESLLPSAPSS
jgi:hypothetical protein